MIEKVFLNTVASNGSLLNSCRETIKADYFTDDVEKELFNAIVKLVEQDVHDATIFERLCLNESFSAYLQGNQSHGSDFHNFGQVAKEVSERGRLKQIKNIANMIAWDGEVTYDSAVRMLSEALEQSHTLETSKVQTLGHYLKEGGLERLFAPPTDKDILKSGFYDLDKYLKPKAGQLITLAARASIGKTAFVMSLVDKYMTQGLNGLFYSLEMGRDELTARLAAISCGIDLEDIELSNFTAADYARIQEFALNPNNDNLTIYEEFNPRFQDIRMEAIMQNKKRKLDYIIIDYLTLIDMPDKGNRDASIGYVTGRLKSLAKELQVPIIMLAQLNRNSEDDYPKLHHLRESGNIEMDSDSVVLLWRDRKAQAAFSMARDRGEPVQDLPTKIAIAKNRGGKIGGIDMVFDPLRAQFKNAEGKSWN